MRPVETEDTLPGGRIVLVDATRERMTANQCEVIAVGAFAECDPTRSRAERKCSRIHGTENCQCDDMALAGCAEGDCGGRRVHPCPVRAGDWLVVRPRAYLAGPIPERPERFIHQDDVLAILRED